jgi:hypothetical protein
LLGRAEIHYPDDPPMRSIVQHAEFAEVLVQHNQDTTFLIRPCENSRVTRVFIPIASPYHVMPGDLQFGLGL